MMWPSVQTELFITRINWIKEYTGTSDGHKSQELACGYISFFASKRDALKYGSPLWTSKQ